MTHYYKKPMSKAKRNAQRRSFCPLPPFWNDGKPWKNSI